MDGTNHDDTDREERYGPNDITPADDVLSIDADGTATVHRCGENVEITLKNE